MTIHQLILSLDVTENRERRSARQEDVAQWRWTTLMNRWRRAMDRGRNLRERHNRDQKAKITFPELRSFEFSSIRQVWLKPLQGYSGNANVMLQPFKQNLGGGARAPQVPPLVPPLVAYIFQLRLAPGGYEYFAEELKPIRDGKILQMNNNLFHFKIGMFVCSCHAPVADDRLFCWYFS